MSTLKLGWEGCAACATTFRSEYARFCRMYARSSAAPFKATRRTISASEPNGEGEGSTKPEGAEPSTDLEPLAGVEPPVCTELDAGPNPPASAEPGK